MKPLLLRPHLTRFISMYQRNDAEVPSQLFSEKSDCFDDAAFAYPMPFRKKDITFAKKCGNVVWYGSKKGVARYSESEEYIYDKVMYFSADRDLPDDDVKSIYGDGNNVWVLTESGISHIELKMITAEKKADLLLDETVKIVDRMGMVSNRGLDIPGKLESKEKFHDSDNDGGFTASFCIGQMMHYDILKREKGKDDEETIRIGKIAMRSLEACLLLMFISGRDDGFVARTYITADSPLPDDGLFLHKRGGKAYVTDTTFAKNHGIVGMACDASAEVPERLKHLYRDEGYTDDDIIFKGDTSSDEITLHFTNLYYAHKIFGDEDKELDSIIKKAASGLMEHIVEHEHELVDFHGNPTSWARWSTRYFTDGIGWGDAPLNAAELLMYLKVTESICGKDKKWTDAYNHLLSEGYAELIPLHYDRAFGAGIYMGCEVTEDLMYGDHMLANLSFFGLMMLEKDEKLRDYYYKGWMSWRDSSIAREHHPIYDIPFAAACPESFVDGEKLKMWFYRSNVSELASGVGVSKRCDVPVKEYYAGYKQTSYLLPPDERAISKYDRDSLKYVDVESGGMRDVEMCSPYTTAYWMGRYYGLIEEVEN